MKTTDLDLTSNILNNPALSPAKESNKNITIDIGQCAEGALDINQYNAIEKNALEKLPNRVLSAFGVFLFARVGYPLSVNSNPEVEKYIDVMHERRGDDDFRDLLGNITPQEFEDLKRVNYSVNEFSLAHFKKKAIAANVPIRGLNVLRHLRFLVGDQKLRIFESGPGCAYLGGMLIQNGHYYASTDVTQGFYIYQNHYLNHLTKGKMREFAKASEDISTWKTTGEDSMSAHIPWWDYAELRPGKIPEFDIFSCNHALCEMHVDCAMYTARTAREMLRGSGFKAVVFEGWGWAKENSVESVTKAFYTNGFVMVHYDPYITVFVPADSEYAVNAQVLPVKGLNESIRVNNGQAQIAQDEFISYNPAYWTSQNNPISEAILNGRKQIASQKTVTLNEVKSFYTSIIGPEHRTEDEKFWDYINKPHQ